MAGVRAGAAIRTAFLEGAACEALARDAGVPLGAMKSCIRRGLISMRAAPGDEWRTAAAPGGRRLIARSAHPAAAGFRK